MKTLRTITTALAMAAAIVATPALFAQTATPKSAQTAPSVAWQNVWLRDLPQPWAAGQFDDPKVTIYARIREDRLYLIGMRNERANKHKNDKRTDLSKFIPEIWILDFASGEIVRGVQAVKKATEKFGLKRFEWNATEDGFDSVSFSMPEDTSVILLNRRYLPHYQLGTFDTSSIPDWEIYSENLPYDFGTNEETYNPFEQKFEAIYKDETPEQRRFEVMVFVHDPKGRPLRFKSYSGANWKRSHLRSLSLYFFWLPDNSLLALSQYEGLALRLTFDKERGFASPAIDNKRLFLVPYEDYEKAIIGHPKYFKEDNVWLEKTILDWLKSRR